MDVRAYTKRKIEALCIDGDRAKGQLAQLRRGIGTIPGDRPELWALLFDGMPEEMLSQNGIPTKEEWAVHIALTLFALHQQGRDAKAQCMNAPGERLGKVLNRLAGGDADKMIRIKSRFDATATAINMTELAHHLRSLIQLLRAEGIPLDYPQLANDLLYFQIPSQAASVRLRWGQDFYFEKTTTSDDGKEG